MARELPGARLTVIPDCGHIPQEERPEAFMGVVTAFIEEGL
jgi:pimeloyl-ACP methyl ester carboxylesterase